MEPQEPKSAAGRLGLRVATITLLVAVPFSLLVFHRSLSLGVTRSFYDRALSGTSPLEDPSDPPLLAALRLLETWEGIRGEELVCSALELVLPTPLRWTGTTHVPNDPERRALLIQRIVEELEERTGQTFGPNLGAWQEWVRAERRS